MLLDPEGPIRYRKISVMPDSLGTLLATLCAEPESNREGIRDIVGHVRGDLLAGARAGARSWATSERLDALQFASFSGPGSGIERTLYALNPEMPCLSPTDLAAYPTRLQTLLRQLESVARTADFHTSPLDAHSAAFLAQHAGIGRHALGALLGRPPHQGERAIVELRLLSAAQTAAGGTSLPLLTNWMANRTAGLANRIRNRPLRKRISAHLGSARESGQLGELLRLLDAAKTWEDDARGFQRARELHRRAGLQAVRLRNEMGAAMRQALERGREAAAAAAAFSAFVIVALGLLMRAV